MGWHSKLDKLTPTNSPPQCPWLHRTLAKCQLRWPSFWHMFKSSPGARHTVRRDNCEVLDVQPPWGLAQDGLNVMGQMDGWNDEARMGRLCF